MDKIWFNQKSKIHGASASPDPSFTPIQKPRLRSTLLLFSYFFVNQGSLFTILIARRYLLQPHIYLCFAYIAAACVILTQALHLSTLDRDILSQSSNVAHCELLKIIWINILFEIQLSEFITHTSPVQCLVSRKFPVMLGAMRLLLDFPLLKKTLQKPWG